MDPNSLSKKKLFREFFFGGGKGHDAPRPGLGGGGHARVGSPGSASALMPFDRKLNIQYNETNAVKLNHA